LGRTLIFFPKFIINLFFIGFKQITNENENQKNINYVKYFYFPFHDYYYFIEVKAALLIKAISTVELDFLLKEVSHALLLFPSHY